MSKIDPAEYRKRLDQLGAILTEIAIHAGQVSTARCPYKDRFDRCTAQFGCRNQRPPATAGDLRVCAGDDKLDYRSAWETGA
jgi:hypothetical protein